MRYAKVSFTHLDRKFHEGDEVELHDPMVEARPDLFSRTAPKPAAKAKPAPPAKPKSDHPDHPETKKEAT